MGKALKIKEDMAEENELSTLETPESVETAAEVDELKKIEAVLRDAEVSGGLVRIERKGPADLKWQFIGKMKVEDFDHEHIKAVYGGGDYRVQTFKSNGSYYKKFSFSIDYRFKGSMDVQQLTPVPGGDTTKPVRDNALAMQMAQHSDSTKLLMEIMTSSQDKQSQTMMLMMNMMMESSKQNVAMMAGMFQALSAVLGKPATDGTSAIIPIILEMVKGGRGGGSNIGELVEAVKQIKAISQDREDKEEKEEDMLDKVLKYGGPIITALMTKTPLQMPGVAGNGPVIDAQATTQAEPKVLQSAPAPKVETQQEKAAVVLQKINMYLEILADAAEKDAETSAYAQMVSDMLSDEHFETLLTELKAADWFNKVANGNPRIIACEAWFTILRQDILTMEEFNESEPNISSESDGSRAGSPAVS